MGKKYWDENGPVYRKVLPLHRFFGLHPIESPEKGCEWGSESRGTHINRCRDYPHGCVKQ